jgi:hypothetical protein
MTAGGPYRVGASNFFLLVRNGPKRVGWPDGGDTPVRVLGKEPCARGQMVLTAPNHGHGRGRPSGAPVDATVGLRQKSSGAAMRAVARGPKSLVPRSA